MLTFDGELNINLQFDGDLAVVSTFDGEYGEFTELPHEAYRGDYTITPGDTAVVMETAGLLMAQNVTINPIPSNYGLITWNGSVFPLTLYVTANGVYDVDDNIRVSVNVSADYSLVPITIKSDSYYNNSAWIYGSQGSSAGGLNMYQLTSTVTTYYIPKYNATQGLLLLTTLSNTKSVSVSNVQLVLNNTGMTVVATCLANANVIAYVSDTS